MMTEQVTNMSIEEFYHEVFSLLLYFILAIVFCYNLDFLAIQSLVLCHPSSVGDSKVECNPSNLFVIYPTNFVPPLH